MKLSRQNWWPRVWLAAVALLLLAGCNGPGAPEPTSISPAMRELRDRGLAELENEQPERAEQHFSKLLAILPNDPLPRTNLSIALLRQQRLDEARAALAPLLGDQASARSLALSAAIAQQAGDLPAALDQLQRALSRDNTDSEVAYAAFNLANQLRDEQAESLAATALARLQALRPDNPWVSLKHLQRALAADQRAEATASFLRLRELSWRFDEAAVAVMDALEAALNGAELESARADALRLENLLRASPLYRESLSELRVGILGVPLEQFALPAEPANEAVAAEISFSAQPLPGSQGETLAFAGADLDEDGRADIVQLVSVAESAEPRLRWFLAADQPAVSGELSLVGIPATGRWQLRLVDLDNDNALDALLWGDSGTWLVRGDSAEGFIAPDAESAPLLGPTPALTAVDFDHEGDLDLVYIDAEGTAQLQRNNLSGALQPVGAGAFVGQVAAFAGPRWLLSSDLDLDEDLDLLLLHEDGIARFDNRRYGEFALQPGSLGGAGVQAMAAADFDNDGAIDLLMADATQVRLAINQSGEFAAAQASAHQAGSVAQLLVADLNNDGRKDWVLRGSDRTEVYLQGAALGMRLAWSSAEALGPLQIIDVDGDGQLDLLFASADGLILWRNQSESENGWLALRLKGLTDGNSKNNSYGLGASLEIRNGDAYQRYEVTDSVTHIGLGSAQQAQVLRVLWTNGVPQNRFDLQRNQAVVEEQVLKGSCPFLYAWNGERYEFVTDLLWGAPLGLPVAPGVWLPADPSELVRVDGLVADQGVYRLQITEELWEAAFFDYLRLWVVDHPLDVEVTSSLRIVPGQNVADQILASRNLQPLAHAYDGHGMEVTATVAERDEVYAAGYTPSRYQGVAADPWTFTMDLGKAPTGPVRLHLEGWIFPADASLNLAVAQRSDLPYLPPRIEVETSAGWVPLMDNAGFPAGKTKAMVIDLPPLPAGSQRLRMVTNLWLHWDRIRWTEHADDQAFELRAQLQPETAVLSERGYSRLLRQAPNAPHAYDYDRVSKEAPWQPLPGNYTKLGEVLPLLETADDFSVILAAGDQLSVRFDARALAEPAPGMRRTLFLESHGWDKDADLNTYEAQQLEPLPFRAMSGYPWAEDEAYPDTPAHRDYRARWLTRKVQ